MRVLALPWPPETYHPYVGNIILFLTAVWFATSNTISLDHFGDLGSLYWLVYMFLRLTILFYCNFEHSHHIPVILFISVWKYGLKFENAYLASYLKSNCGSFPGGRSQQYSFSVCLRILLPLYNIRVLRPSTF